MTWRRAGSKSKYNNTKVVVGGRKEDSKGQARRHLELESLEASGKIRNLSRQVDIPLYGINKNVICKIVVDWTYMEDNLFVAEDYKGYPTDVFFLKKKLYEDNYPGTEFRLSGPYEKIMEKKRAKARARYAAKKKSSSQ